MNTREESIAPGDDSRDELDNTFFRKLMGLLNEYSMENHSDTPDFLLADYMMGCLNAYQLAVCKRDQFHNIHLWQNIDSPQS